MYDVAGGLWRGVQSVLDNGEVEVSRLKGVRRVCEDIVREGSIACVGVVGVVFVGNRLPREVSGRRGRC